MPTPPKPSWAVVGGGALGLACAKRLAERGHRVTVYEAGRRLGGLAAAWSLDLDDGYTLTWDRHYHVTLLSDAYTRGLLDDLGLDGDMQWVTTHSGLFDGRRLAPLTTSLDFLRLPGLGLVGKARLAATISRGARITDWQPLEHIPVEDWLRAKSGNRVFENLWRPLLRAKLGEAYTQTSAAFIWATIQRLYAARRSGLKVERFGYLPGGYDRFFHTLAQHLTAQGVTLHTDAPVQRVARSGDGFTIQQGKNEYDADRVLFTTPPALTARIAADLTDAERDAMTALPYQGILCASVVLDAPLTHNYLTYLTDESLPFTAVIDMSALVHPDELGGRGLVYLPLYTTPDDERYQADDAALRERFLAALRRVYPALDERTVHAFRISRVPHVFPVPVLGYSKQLAPIALATPGLYALNSSHIVNGTLNVNDTLRTAEAFIAEHLDAPPRDASPA